MIRILAPHHPPCYLIDFLQPPYPLVGFGEMEDIELLVNQWDLTIKLVVFEPDNHGGACKIGIITYERDEFPTAETLSRLYNELTTLDIAIRYPEKLAEICDIRVKGIA